MVLTHLVSLSGVIFAYYLNVVLSYSTSMNLILLRELFRKTSFSEWECKYREIIFNLQQSF